MRKIFILITLCTSVAVMATEGALSGRFTINAYGDQVVFSQGNLQYQASTDTWRFALDQYEVVGKFKNDCIGEIEALSPTLAQEGWIDHFGWGTGNNPTLSSENNDDYSTFVDWGVNAISNGGNEPNLWRTLTKDEWVYIFNGRPNADKLWGLGRVDGVCGIIILPDNWKTPAGISFSPFLECDGNPELDQDGSAKISKSVGVEYSHYMKYVDSEQGLYLYSITPENRYDLMSWIDCMEATGVVFLPLDYHFDSCDNYYENKANYWTGTPLGRSNSYQINICIEDQQNNYHYDHYNAQIDVPNYASRNNAYSVRLVQDVENTSDLTEDYTISYLAKDATTLADEDVTLRLPQAPQIEGFTFFKWLVKENDLADGINIQAVYTSDTPTTAPEVVNPANKAQKLIRQGNVYILSEGKTYSVQGQKVK